MTARLKGNPAMKRIKIAIIAAALLALPNALNAQEGPVRAPPPPPGCKLVCVKVDGFYQCHLVCQ